MVDGLNGSLVVFMGQETPHSIMWYSYLDKREKRLTEYERSAIEMQLSSRYKMGIYKPNARNNLEGQDDVLLITSEFAGVKKFAAIIVDGEIGYSDEEVINAVQEVLARGSKYNVEKFLSEVDDILKGLDRRVITEFIQTPDEALKILKATDYETSNIITISILLLRALSPQIEVVDMRLLGAIAMDVLGRLDQESDIDIPLDACFNLATMLEDHEELVNDSAQIYKAITEHTSKNRSRLQLHVSTLLNLGGIYYRNFNARPHLLEEVLESIDDGDLQVVTRQERETYYVLKGHLMLLKGEEYLALEFYQMALALVEQNMSPSYFLAEAHNYMSYYYLNRRSLDLSIKHSLSAYSIARQYGKESEAFSFISVAAQAEWIWSQWLMGSAMLERMNEKFNDASYAAWKSLRMILNSISHSTAELIRDIYHIVDDLLTSMTALVDDIYGTSEPQSFLAKKIFNDLTEFFTDLFSGEILEDEILIRIDFFKTQIDNMLPSSVPIFLLIANDGRLMTAGPVNEDNWENVGGQEDLLSGALSAVMTIIAEVTDTSAALRSIDAGDTNILIEWTPYAIGALLTTRETGGLKDAMKQAMLSIINEFDTSLISWDGFSLDLSKVPKLVNPHFTNIVGDSR